MGGKEITGEGVGGVQGGEIVQGKAGIGVETGEGTLVAEEKALHQVVKGRREELAVAQLARERMSAIFSAEEITMMAERQRARASYQKELEHASSPLLPKAWLGIIQDRLEDWKATHKPTLKKQRSEPTSQDYQVKSKSEGSQPLTPAQLLAGSRQGTGLEEVVQVVVYRNRHAVQLDSLRQCPNLRTATLVKCGLEIVTPINPTHCPHLTELGMPVCLHMFHTCPHTYVPHMSTYVCSTHVHIRMFHTCPHTYVYMHVRFCSPMK